MLPVLPVAERPRLGAASIAADRRRCLETRDFDDAGFARRGYDR